MYEGAGKVYAALEEHLRSTSGKGGYFFGDKPSSLDAAIFAHLVFHHGAPVSAPELRQKVSGVDHTRTAETCTFLFLMLQSMSALVWRYACSTLKALE